MLVACGDDSNVEPWTAPPGVTDAGDGEGDAGDAATVSYSRDVEPIFQQKCVICHHQGGIIEDLSHPFDPKTGIVNRPNGWREDHGSPYELLVKPGDADASFLIYKVATDPAIFDEETNGGPMPGAVPNVTADELATIRKWIEDGAKNDSFFTDQVAAILGSAITLGRRAGKCTFCHYPGSSTGLNILAVFDSKVGLVGVDSLLSSKPRVAAGDPDGSFLIEKLQPNPSAGAQMPLNYPRLTEAQVDILRRWIDQGAKDN